MASETYLFLGLFLAGIVFIVWFLNRKLSAWQNNAPLTEWLKSVQSSLELTNRTLNETLRSNDKNLSDTLMKSNRNVNERLDNASRYLARVAQEVGKMSELNRSIRDLQLFLQSPKLRGNLGEEVLKDLIAQVFPQGSFFLQYSFQSGEKVDAAIKTAAGILPIDSKFPMENFKRLTLAESKLERQTAQKGFHRDVKKHLEDISRKYIKPEEGTLDFAFMYLPSEAVFSEVAGDTLLLETARRLRVYPVSPNTLYVHLQTVLLSFEGQKIEVRSRQVFRLLRAVQKDYEETGSVLTLLGKHLSNAYHQMSNVRHSFSLLGEKLVSTRSLGTSDEPVGELDEKT